MGTKLKTIQRNMDSLYFPRSAEKMREWVEGQLEEEDEFRFIAVTIILLESLKHLIVIEKMEPPIII